MRAVQDCATYVVCDRPFSAQAKQHAPLAAAVLHCLHSATRAGDLKGAGQLLQGLQTYDTRAGSQRVWWPGRALVALNEMDMCKSLFWLLPSAVQVACVSNAGTLQGCAPV